VYQFCAKGVFQGSGKIPGAKSLDRFIELCLKGIVGKARHVLVPH
jgi:hypothetical protein